MTTDAQRLEGYEPFFGLKEAPFSLAPDTRFLFASESHSAALAQVAYAVERREPLVVVTGEIGTGKTLLCRIMLQRLPLKTFLSVIDDPLLESDDLLKQLLEDFGVISKDRAKLTEATRHELVQTLHAFLNSLVRIQAHAVVMIDEAQHLRPDVLEQIRLLSNIDDARGTLLQIILVGQAGLEPLLSRPELRQLQQRVSRRFRLEPLNRHEVEQYIEHRLALARDGKPGPGATAAAPPVLAEGETKPGVGFTPDAIEAVCQLSGGVPRVINLLCNRSLEEAYIFRLRTIDKELIQSAARALGIGEHVAPGTAPQPDAAARRSESGSDESAARAAQADPVPTPPAIEAATVQTAGELPAVLVEPPRPAASRLVPYVSLAVLVVLAGVAILFGVRRARPPAAAAPASTAAPPAARAPVAPVGQTPAAGAKPTPNAPAATATPTPARTGATVPAPVPPVATPNGERFEIVVASFRTDARATSVASEITALGLPIHRRVLEGWQQVVSGPFASRTDAEAAQQRIHRAGLTGTQIVPAPQ